MCLAGCQARAALRQLLVSCPHPPTPPSPPPRASPPAGKAQNCLRCRFEKLAELEAQGAAPAVMEQAAGEAVPCDNSCAGSRLWDVPAAGRKRANNRLTKFFGQVGCPGGGVAGWQGGGGVHARLAGARLAA